MTVRSFEIAAVSEISKNVSMSASAGLGRLPASRCCAYPDSATASMALALRSFGQSLRKSALEPYVSALLISPLIANTNPITSEWFPTIDERALTYSPESARTREFSRVRGRLECDTLDAVLEFVAKLNFSCDSATRFHTSACDLLCLAAIFISFEGA